MEPLRRRHRIGLKPAILACLAGLSLVGCAPTLMPPGPAVTQPVFAPDSLTMADGARLPLYVWHGQGEPKAVIVALHGFNDYGTFIKAAGAYWAERGIATFAYDQRGFGDAPNRGLWAGSMAMSEDLTTAARLIGARHPGVPLFVLGDSMGGAVTLTAMTGIDPPRTDGVILVAPAVWGRSTMPFYQRWALWVSAHTVPSMTLSGRGLNITPSDNIEMLRALGRDPKVIKETRIDTIWGLTNLMDEALDVAAQFDAPALILYGSHDEIIPEKPMRAMLDRRPAAARDRQTVIWYDDAYHMLLRDLAAERAWKDVLAWIDRRRAALPSETHEVRSAPTRR